MIKISDLSVIGGALIVIGVLFGLLLIFGILWFNGLPISKTPPDWGDGIALLTSLATLVSIFILFYQQKKFQQQREIDRINGVLGDLEKAINGIQYDKKIGIEAIKEYGEKYKKESENHPRTVLDRLIYIITEFEKALIDIADLKHNRDSFTLARKALLLFYTMLYYNLYSHDGKKKRIVNKCEEEYKLLYKIFEDLSFVSYDLLYRKWEIIEKHNESEKIFHKDYEISRVGLKEAWEKLSKIENNP